MVPVGLIAGQAGERTGAFVEVKGGLCLVAVARAAATVSDADVHVFSDGGDLLAADESRRADASVVLCPPLPERLYVSGRIVTGQGIMALGAATLRPEQAEAVARSVGARFGTLVAEGAPGPWADAERALDARRAAVGPSWPELRRVLMPVESRALSQLSVPVGAERCIDVLAAPREAVNGLEMAISDPTGRVLAHAPPNGRERAQAVCAHEARTAVIGLRAIGTSGSAVVFVRESPEGGWVELDAPVWLDAPRARGTVADGVKDLSTRLGASWGPDRRVGTATALVGQALRFPVELRAGCSRLDVVAGEPLVGIGAELWSSTGQRLAASSGRASAALFYCGDRATAVVEVAAATRSGPFAIEHRYVPVRSGPALDHGRAAAHLLGRFEERGVWLEPADLARASVVDIGTDERAVVPVVLPSRGCVRVAAAATGEPGGLLRLRVAAAVGSRAELYEAGHVVDARVCGSGAPAQARVELEVTRGDARALFLSAREPSPQ